TSSVPESATRPNHATSVVPRVTVPNAPGPSRRASSSTAKKLNARAAASPKASAEKLARSVRVTLSERRRFSTHQVNTNVRGVHNAPSARDAAVSGGAANERAILRLNSFGDSQTAENAGFRRFR